MDLGSGGGLSESVQDRTAQSNIVIPEIIGDAPGNGNGDPGGLFLDVTTPSVMDFNCITVTNIGSDSSPFGSISSGNDFHLWLGTNKTEKLYAVRIFLQNLIQSVMTIFLLLKLEIFLIMCALNFLINPLKDAEINRKSNLQIVKVNHNQSI